jgi:hypothetical protein
LEETDMNRKLLAAAAATLLGIASPSWATLVTIDFDAFPSFSNFAGGSDDGFTLTAKSAFLSATSSLLPGFSTPNLIVTDSTGNWILTLVETDASAFEFLGLNGASSSSTSANLTVRGFQGTTLVGTDTYSATTGALFNASALSGLALTKVEIEGQYGGSASGISAFADNIRLETDATISAVPEPGTLALAGLAVAGLGLSRRRRAG